jgi:hypothetical protein
MLPPTDRPVLDRYLADGYETVRGMSSRFAATICSHLLLHQTTLGIGGHAAEIGTFEGRFFIALALALEPGQRAAGIDLFNWPNAGLYDLFVSHVRRHQVPEAAFVPMRCDSRTLPPAALTEALGGGMVRFFHIDGEHGHDSLVRDLALAEAVVDPRGLIVLDDMLHPAYPTLGDTVHTWLRERPEWRVLCLLDREDIVAAAKYVLCRAEAVPLYAPFLEERFAPQVFLMGADFVSHVAIVLTPHPRLAEVE